MPNMLPGSLQRSQRPNGLQLTGMECELPPAGEQVKKRQQALTRLQSFVEACGGRLADGWDCAVRCRITSRKNGRPGVTTDNYYYSPTGQTFRNHKQVAEFLGLSQPQQDDSQQASSSKVTTTSVTATQQDQQLSSHTSYTADASTAYRTDSCIGETPLKRPCIEHACSAEQQTAKRTRTVAVAASGRRQHSVAPLPLFDLSFAAQAARSAASHSAALAAQAALMGPITPSTVPAAAPSSTQQRPVASHQQQQPEQCSVLSANEPAVQHAAALMPPPAPQPRKWTKAQLAVKYAASSSSGSTAAAPAPAGTSPCGHQCPSEIVSPSSTCGSSISSQEQQLAAQATPQRQQQQVQSNKMSLSKQSALAQSPSIASTDSGLCTAAMSAAAAAGNNTDCTASSPPRRQQQQQQHIYRTKDLKPRYLQQQQQPKSHKAKKQPDWRARLRELASEFAAGRGTVSANGSAGSKSSSSSQQQAL